MRLFTSIAFIFLLIFFADAQDIEKIKARELTEKYGSGNGVYVVNFWSTWCKPCIEEIPHFIKVYESFKSRGVELWLVSQDTKDLYHSQKLADYIKVRPDWMKARLFWFDETNADYYCPVIDEQWSGVIPATLIINPSKGYRKFIEESLSEDDLKREIERAL